MTQSRSLSVFPSFSIPDTALSCNKYNFWNVDNAGTKNLKQGKKTDPIPVFFGLSTLETELTAVATDRFLNISQNVKCEEKTMEQVFLHILETDSIFISP